MRSSAKDMIDALFEKLTNPFYGLTKYIPGMAAYKTKIKLKRSQRIIDQVVATELDLLLEEYNGGTKAMLAEARVFVQAGFETTAHSLAFAMGMMAERPDLAEKMYKQGLESLGQDTCYDVDKMKVAIEETKLVSYFFHEAFRLYPLAPSLGGECTNDIELSAKDGTKYSLPRGTATVFLNMSLQRQIADNPNEIQLEQWDTKP